MNTFTKDPLHIDDIVVYLKNERTGSSTIRKCKFIGQIIEFSKIKVKIKRFSPPDTFVHIDEIQDFNIDIICPDDVVHIIISKHTEDYYTEALQVLNQDIKLLIGKWFSALEDEGVDPWADKECITMASKFEYTEEDYKKYLNTIV